MWKNIAEPGRPQMAIWPLRIACWIPNVTNTHPDYVILIAFPFNSGCTNMPQFYVICTLLVLFMCNDIRILCVKICQIFTDVKPSWRFSADVDSVWGCWHRVEVGSGGGILCHHLQHQKSVGWARVTFNVKAVDSSETSGTQPTSNWC